jgi:outer membrane receptor protein involved in Fe transport
VKEAKQPPKPKQTKIVRKPVGQRFARAPAPARGQPRHIAGTIPVVSPAVAAPAGNVGAGAAGPANPQTAIVASARAGEAQARALRDNVAPKGPANSTSISRENIDNLPAGTNTPFDKVLLQLPGVSQDSAGSGDFHVRNEHANVQYRINGILLPDGVSGFSQVLDSTFIRELTLLDGALPAEYGLHTAGIIDIQTRNGADDPGTTVDLYGGSYRTIQPTITQSGVVGRWDYFVSGRFTSDNLGIENPTPAHDAIHDDTRQGRYFAYVSGQLEDGSRLTFMSGASLAAYQIPNSAGTPPAFTAFGVSNFDSALLNENQVERSIFSVLAWQKSFGAVDSQVSYFQRYSELHFTPDPIGDIVFNGVASDVTRSSLVNGIQSDNAYRTSTRNTLRFGFTAQIEHAVANDTNTVLPTDASGNPIDSPFILPANTSKTGTVDGVYLSDEYDLTRELAVTGGLRYDYMGEYVTTDQLSPRLGIVYKPVDTTTFHAGYARYFTPPELALSGPTPVLSFNNTTLASDVTESSPVRPERSHYFDVGVTQHILPGLDVGLDGYYKIANNLLDDGQFGQALVLTAFNYAKAYNEGGELKINYVNGGLRAYGNLSVAQQRATQVSSNQYLFDPDELAYIQDHYIFTDHDQLFTVSGGGSYKIGGTTFSTDVVYGSGLRDGFANTGTVAPHAVVNLGVSQDVTLLPGGKPTTFRLTVVNVADIPYAIRDGSGIGVFQAQYGSRRAVYGGITQRF